MAVVPKPLPYRRLPSTQGLIVDPAQLRAALDQIRRNFWELERYAAQVHTHDGAGTNSSVLGGTAEVAPGTPTASADQSMALGDRAVASGIGTVALGSSSSATFAPSATANAAIAIGVDWDGTGNGPVASSPGSIAIGGGGTFSGSPFAGANAAGGRCNVVIGPGASATGFFGDGPDMVVVGKNAKSNSGQGVVIGVSASIQGNAAASAVIIGDSSSSNSTSQSPIAIGNAAKAGNGAVAIGQDADATFTAGNQRSVAIARGSIAGGDGAVAIGPGASAAGNQALAIGGGATGLGGSSPSAGGARAVAVGQGAVASNADSVAIGSLSSTAKASQLKLGTINEVVTLPGGVEFQVLSKSGTYTALSTDTYIHCDASGAAFTLTLPASASANKGHVLIFKKIDSSANAVTIQRGSTDTIDGSTTKLLSAQFDQLIVLDRGNGNWDVLNSGAPGGGAATFGTAIGTTIGEAAGAGSGTNSARDNHIHDRNNDAAIIYMEPSGGDVSRYPAVSTSATFGTPIGTTIGEAAGAGSGTNSARDNHVHDRNNDAAIVYMEPSGGDVSRYPEAVVAGTTFGSPAQTTIGDAAGDGGLGTSARADHGHNRNNDAAIVYMEPGAGVVSIYPGGSGTTSASAHNHDGTGATSTLMGGTKEGNPGAPTASGVSAMAIGDFASSTGVHSIVIGGGGEAQGTGHTSAAKATGDRNVVIGPNASSVVAEAVVIGRSANATTGDQGVAIGRDAAVKADGVAVGVGAGATTTSSVALGGSASAGTGTFAMALGNSAVATGASSVAIGAATAASGAQSVALGGSSSTNGHAIASAGGTIAIGSNTANAAGPTANTATAIAIGSGDGTRVGAVASAARASALGSGSTASHADSWAVGTSAATTKTKEIVLGDSTYEVNVQGTLQPFHPLYWMSVGA